MIAYCTSNYEIKFENGNILVPDGIVCCFFIEKKKQIN